MTALKAQPKKDLGQKTYMADKLKTKLKGKSPI